MSIRVGLYGGSFNPIHCGHLIVARTVGESLRLDRVVFLPSRQPPHKADRTLLDAHHRAEMVQLAIAEERLFEFSDFDLIRHGPCYTIDAVTHFRRQLCNDAELSWIIGADSLAELSTWHRAGELVEACRIVTVHRPGWDQIDWSILRNTFDEAQVASLHRGVIEAPRIEISSTDIRQRIQAGRSIAFLVPDAVRAYIEANALYAVNSTSQ